jgi:hypothetical protein
MPKAILFDLDGTLIDDSMETFLPPYFAALTKKLAHLIAPEKLIAQLHASTRAMVANTDPTRHTRSSVCRRFLSASRRTARKHCYHLFDDFYAREYRELRIYVNPIPEARIIVQRACARCAPPRRHRDDAGLSARRRRSTIGMGQTGGFGVRAHHVVRKYEHLQTQSGVLSRDCGETGVRASRLRDGGKRSAKRYSAG